MALSLLHSPHQQLVIRLDRVDMYLFCLLRQKPIAHNIGLLSTFIQQVLYYTAINFQIPHVKIDNYSRSEWSWRNLRQKRKFYVKNTMIKESPPSKVNKCHSPFILTNLVIVVRDEKVSLWEESIVHFILPSIVIPLPLSTVRSTDLVISVTRLLFICTTRMAKANLLSHNCAIPVMKINAFYYLPLEIDCILIYIVSKQHSNMSFGYFKLCCKHFNDYRKLTTHL